MNIPESMRKSRGLQLVISQGWTWKEASGDQIQVETCPVCKKGDYKFYMRCCDPALDSRDGTYFCHKGSCQTTGNIKTLQELLGIRIPGVDSRSAWAGQSDKIDSLPDPDECHNALIGNAEALDYLVNVRGFTREIIDQQKIGLKEKVYFGEAGEVKAIVYPYLVNDNIVFAKYRTLPPAPKDFRSSGGEVPLYNSEVLTDGCKEIIFVEGEANTCSMLSYGIMNAVGVPGAGIKKASWISKLDEIAPEKIYIFFDPDKAGKKGAQEWASRIGIEKCLKLTVPYFEVTVPADECKLCKGKNPACEHKRLGKDFNEWFMKGGGTKEKFEQLKEHAKLFDVTGVTSSKDAMEQLEDELNGRIDLSPSYITPWKELNRYIGFENGDVIDIMGAAKQGKSSTALNLLDHMAAKYGEDGLFVCLEMNQARLAKKWVSIVTGFEDTITEPGTEESRRKLAELKEAVTKAKEIQQGRDADIYFAYPLLVKEPEDIFKLIRDCIRRYGVKWVVFDNIQRLCDDTLKNANLRTVHLSQISKGFAKLAKDYNIKLIRIVQPKKIDKADTISPSDIDGSSQIDKDCDCLITLWRRSVSGNVKVSEYEEESEQMSEGSESFDPKMKVTVALSRYSSGGHTFLFFDGARSQVRSYDEQQKLELKQKNFNGIVVQNGVPTEANNVETISI